MGTPKTVLIIDDEVNIAQLVSLQLEAKGYRTHVALDGKEGLAKIPQVSPDLIILDINMPQMNGLQFLNATTTPRGKFKYPVLVLTSRENLKDTFIDVAVAGFLRKPFLVEDLLREVERILTEPFQSVVYIFDDAGSGHVQEIKKRLEVEQYDVRIFPSLPWPENLKAGEGPIVIFAEYGHVVRSPEDDVRALTRDVPTFVYTFSDAGEMEKLAGVKEVAGRLRSADYGRFVQIAREREMLPANSRPHN